MPGRWRWRAAEMIGIDDLKRVASWSAEHPRIASALGLLLVAGTGVVAWSGFLGERPERIATWLAGPSPLAGADAAPSVTMELLIQDSDGRERTFVEGMPCRSGETIQVHISSADAAHVLVFGWDGSDAYPFTEATLAPQYRRAGEFRDAVTLDDRIGSETVYVIAAASPFSFADDIRPRLVHGEDSGKGGMATHPRLGLPARFAIDAASCRHLP